MLLFGGFPKLGVPFLGTPHNKDYSILGSILGSPYIGKLPFVSLVLFVLILLLLLLVVLSVAIGSSISIRTVIQG